MRLHPPQQSFIPQPGTGTNAMPLWIRMSGLMHININPNGMAGEQAISLIHQDHRISGERQQVQQWR
jgi:hypothetical protein